MPPRAPGLTGGIPPWGLLGEETPSLLEETGHSGQGHEDVCVERKEAGSGPPRPSWPTTALLGDEIPSRPRLSGAAKKGLILHPGLCCLFFHPLWSPCCVAVAARYGAGP